VESGDHADFRIGETIPPEANLVLRQLEIYDAFLAEGHDPCYGSCSYWGDDRRGYNDSLLSPHGHGWHLDRARFDVFLAQQAQQAGTEVITKSKFQASQHLESGGFGLTIATQSGQLVTVAADTVVDATGTRGVFAAQQGSVKISTDPLVCLAMRFALEKGARGISRLTHLEGVEYGWWYAARIPNEIVLVAVYSDVEAIKEKGLNHPENWLLALQSTPNTGRLAEGLELLDDRPRAFPASSYRLNRTTGSGWLAIGDAASACDPITSQGILKSMTDGILAAKVLVGRAESASNEFPEFEFQVANRYEQYLEIRKHLYRLETRWPESRFWKKYQSCSDWLPPPMVAKGISSADLSPAKSWKLGATS
jgi:flavin-dependent dehydrogenase